MNATVEAPKMLSKKFDVEEATLVEPVAVVVVPVVVVVVTPVVAVVVLDALLLNVAVLESIALIP